MRMLPQGLTMSGLTVVATLAACSVPQSDTRSASVFYASGADLQSINPLLTVHPLAKAVQKHVLLLTLAAYDEAMHPVPRLATWSWGPDRTSLMFHLRTDVQWHDGVPTTAEDVRWTLETAQQADVAYPRARDLESIAAVDVVDSARVLVRFRHSQPTFPDVLTDLAILPAHRFTNVRPGDVRLAEFNRQPVGNGPFAFVEYRPNQRWVFRRHEDFPVDLSPAELERFVVVVVDEPSTKLAALTSGELDFAGIAPAHAEFVRSDPRLRVIDYPVFLVAALVWNLRRAPFDDRDVRMAMTMAIDRQLIVDAYLYGFGHVTDGPVPPEHPWFENIERQPFDPNRAEALLERAGWRRIAGGIRERDGKRLALELLTVGSGDNALEQMIQAQLRTLGVEVRIRQLEFATFLAVAQGPERDFDALVTLIPGNLSLGYLAAMFSGVAPGPLSYPGWRNSAFDAAVARAERATTAAALEVAWRDAQRILADDHPTTWLYHARGLQGASGRLQGVTVDLRGELATLAQWRIASATMP